MVAPLQPMLPLFCSMSWFSPHWSRLVQNITAPLRSQLFTAAWENSRLMLIAAHRLHTTCWWSLNMEQNLRSRSYWKMQACGIWLKCQCILMFNSWCLLTKEERGNIASPSLSPKDSPYSHINLSLGFVIINSEFTIIIIDVILIIMSISVIILTMMRI